MLKEIFQRVSELFPKAKFYEGGAAVQNGLYIVFDSVSFTSTQTSYAFKLLVAGNSLNKNSQSVLPQCDNLLKLIEQNRANCFENLPSKLYAQGIQRVSVREGLYCYEIAFVLEVRNLGGI